VTVDAPPNAPAIAMIRDALAGTIARAPLVNRAASPASLQSITWF